MLNVKYPETAMRKLAESCSDLEGEIFANVEASSGTLDGTDYIVYVSRQPGTRTRVPVSYDPARDVFVCSKTRGDAAAVLRETIARIS